jgi:hypothetical protein
VVVIGLVAADGLSAGRRFPVYRMGRRLGIVVAGAALLTALAEPAAYAVDTAVSPHGGAIPSAGPSAAFGTGSFRGDQADSAAAEVSSTVSHHSVVPD